MKQISLFDLQTEKKSPNKQAKHVDPPCYTCTHGHRRGRFAICRIIKDGGYRHIGEKVECNAYERLEDDKGNTAKSK